MRETYKESGNIIRLKKENLERVALIKFYKGESLKPLTDEPTFEVLCYRIFQSKSDVGTPRDTDEMKDVRWFDSIPFGTHLMKPGDELFVPQIIAGTPIKGYIHFVDNTNEMIDHSIVSCAKEDLVI